MEWDAISTNLWMKKRYRDEKSIVDIHVVRMSGVRIDELGWIYNVCVSKEPWPPWPAQPSGPDRTSFKTAQPARAGHGASPQCSLFYFFFSHLPSTSVASMEEANVSTVNLSFLGNRWPLSSPVSCFRTDSTCLNAYKGQKYSAARIAPCDFELDSALLWHVSITVIFKYLSKSWPFLISVSWFWLKIPSLQAHIV